MNVSMFFVFYSNIIIIFIIKLKKSFDSMGNQQSLTIKNHKEHEIDSPHLLLSNCKLVLAEKNRLLKSSWSFVDKRVYESWKIRFSKHIQKLFKAQSYEQAIKNAVCNFVFFPEYHEYVEIGYCSTNGVVNLVYEMIDDTLVRSIELRSINNEPFTQNEVWIMLYILTKTATYFHENNLMVGDIRPENIFIAENEKFIKIATEYSWICDKSLKQKWQAKQKIFLSEAMIKCMAQDVPPSSKVEFSNDNFAIGMTLAECILLEDLSKIYQVDRDQLIISKQKHSNVVQSLLRIKYYPLKLLLLVIGMIQIEQQNRFTSEQTSRCLDQFKLQILTQNAFIIGKDHLKNNFGNKFDNLYSILSQYKSSVNKKLFINRQLSLSNAYTINGLSTVQMMKRTYDETFNIQMLDFSSNLSPMQLKVSQVDDNNKSWNNTDQKMLNFIQKNKRSNILDQFCLSLSEKKTIKSNEKSKKKPDIIKLTPLMVESDVKFMPKTPEKDKQNQPLIPVTNSNSLYDKYVTFPSPQLKIYEAKRDSCEQNFSFHSPETHQHDLNSPVMNSLNKYKKYFESEEILHLTPQVAQSIIIGNHQSERPQSYVTYTYSKSKQNSNQKDRYESFHNEHLNFPTELLLKKMKKASEINENERDQHFVTKRNSLGTYKSPYQYDLRT